MKRPIEWHMECLENQRIYLKKLIAEKERLLQKIYMLQSDTFFYGEQIEEAIIKGKDGFDAEKFGRKIVHDL